MNPWGYRQPHPHVYVAPQQPGYGYWEHPAWNPQAYEPAAAPAAGYRSAKYPNLNPILAADTTLLRFNIKKKPRTEILASTYYSNYQSPATAGPVLRMRLISKSFPWTIDIVSQTPITCEAIWDALYLALQEHIVDSEWGLIIGDKKKKEIVEKAAKKRGEEDTDKRLKRIDYLGDTTLFKGLDKEDEFEKLRVLPGDKAWPETWVVRLGS